MIFGLFYNQSQQVPDTIELARIEKFSTAATDDDWWASCLFNISNVSRHRPREPMLDSGPAEKRCRFLEQVPPIGFSGLLTARRQNCS
jgi:hypothetical protein